MHLEWGCHQEWTAGEWDKWDCDNRCRYAKGSCKPTGTVVSIVSMT